MGKRSRDVSFSPPSEDSLLPAASTDSSDTPSRQHEKYPAIDYAQSSETPPAEVMKCGLPPHREPVTFSSFEDYDVHYGKEHMNRCSSCGKNFPSTHFLMLHIEENHDPLREALQAKGEKTYGCFVEGCDKKSSTPQKRRLHLIDKHAFPKVYNFRVVDIGIDKSASMLREGHRRRLSTTDDTWHSWHSNDRRRKESSQRKGIKDSSASSHNLEALETDSNADSVQKHPSPSNQDKELLDLASAMSSLRFVPASVLRRQAKSKP